MPDDETDACSADVPAGTVVAELVRRACAGDHAAWNAIVERYATLVWSICRRYGLDRADTDDVAQGVWLRLLESLPGLRVAEALPGWIATTTRRECLRVLGGRSGRAVHDGAVDLEAMVDDRAADADQALLAAERREALRVAFADLGERCRRLLGLLLQDPPPAYTEVGATLGMPVGSIGPVRARCLETLRRSPAIAALLVDDRSTAGGRRHDRPVGR